MALPKIALKDLKDRAVFTRLTRSAFFGAATKYIPRHAYFGFLPHVFHCCSTGSPLRLSQVLFGKNLAFGGVASPLTTQQLRQLSDIHRNPINVLIIIVIGAICFYLIDRFVRDGRLGNLLKILVVLFSLAAPMLGVNS